MLGINQENLIKTGIDINVKNKKDDTFLHVIAENGNDKEAALLLRMGANVTAENYLKQQPIHLAAKNGGQNVQNSPMKVTIN